MPILAIYHDVADIYTMAERERAQAAQRAEEKRRERCYALLRACLLPPLIIFRCSALPIADVFALIELLSMLRCYFAVIFCFR